MFSVLSICCRNTSLTSSNIPLYLNDCLKHRPAILHLAFLECISSYKGNIVLFCLLLEKWVDHLLKSSIVSWTKLVQWIMEMSEQNISNNRKWRSHKNVHFPSCMKQHQFQKRLVWQSIYGLDTNKWAVNT